MSNCQSVTSFLVCAAPDSHSNNCNNNTHFFTVLCQQKLIELSHDGFYEELKNSWTQTETDNEDLTLLKIVNTF
jgi:hypothetical protein